uniref:Protein kinase domain-containing protein n=1 Tax=Panagrellus redivivus TaxID=6233 RepID=A0A7E4V7E9_PANRE
MRLHFLCIAGPSRRMAQSQPSLSSFLSPFLRSVRMANSESEVSVIKINEFISYSSAYYVEYDKRPCHSGIFNTRKALFVVFDAESEAAKEAKILKELDYHPAIIRMFCELKHDDQHFIILEDHSVRLDTYVHMKEFEISLAVDVIGQVAKGLEFLHENQISKKFNHQ